MRRKISMLIVASVALGGLVFEIWAARPTVSISASPATIFSGSSSTLTWSSTGAATASINQGIGSVPVNGSLNVSPIKTMTYTITVRNSSGYRTASVKVTVKPALPIVTFGAAPGSIIQGQSSTLSWTTGNATAASINQGIGTVALNGSRAVSPSATTTYTITVTGSGGTVMAAVIVIVNAGAPTITFSASPTTVQAGQGSTLSWTTVSATSVTIEPGIGITGLNGSATVFPTQTTIYTLTASGPGGTSSSQVEVQVQALAPTVTLTANPAAIQVGETATLSWTSSNADSALLDNSIGVVDLNGSMPVLPFSTTTYTISVTGPGGSKTASATVTVFSGIRYYAYIPDYYDKKIRIIDTNTGAICKTIEVTGTSTNLQGVSTDPSGVFAYVADTGTTRIIQIDPLTMTKVNELAMKANFQGKPKHIAVSPDGCYLYATSSVPMWNPGAGKYMGNICAIKTSGSSMSAVRGVMTDLPHQVSLEGLAVSPDNSRLFVADPDNNQILVLDTAKMHRYAADMVAMNDELITAIPITSPPLGVAFSSDGQMLYAFADSTLFEIDAQNLAVIRSVPVPYGSRFMKAHPDGNKIYVVTRDYLSIVETAGFTKSATVGITGLYYCTGLDVHPDGSRIFLADKTSDKLITVSTSTCQVLFTTSVGTDPAAYGGFIGHLPLTISGNVTQDGIGLSGATMTLNGEGILRTKQTAAAGEFLFGLKPGDYQLTPTMSNLAFTPESTNLHVAESQTGFDFAVSGVISPPTVALSSSSTWVKQSESFTLTWDSTGADYVTLEMVTSNHLPPSGSRTVTLQSTSTIWAVAYNRGGAASAGVKVYVSSSDPPTAGIIANPASILQGGSSTLSWTTAYASTITIDNGIGTVVASGSKVVFPAVTTTYTITAKHYSGYQVTASTTITVSEFDTSAKLTGTVTDSATSQPLNEVTANALDASGVPQTALTDINGKYALANLRVGNVTASFAKTGYDPCQQTIIIPSNTTFDLTTQLHQTQVGATQRGVVKDGQSNQPIVGATVTATYSGSSQTSISAADGSYSLAGIPLGASATITATSNCYLSKSIQQTFSQAKVYTWDFVLYNVSAVATLTGKITNAKTLQPEEGVKVTHEGSNVAKTTAADGTFLFDTISFGEQTFYLEKTDFIEEAYTCFVDHNPFNVDLTKPNSEGGQITIGRNISGVILDSITQLPIDGAKVRMPVLNLEVVSVANGNYSLTDLPIGSYPMLIMALNHQAMTIMAAVVPGETETADFALSPIARGLINGMITDIETGKPVAEANIEIGDLLATSSEDDGTFKLVGIPPGIYTISISQAEYNETLVENIEVFDLTPTSVNIQLSRRPHSGTLAGRIVDVHSGNPVMGASISVSGTSITATADADGNYSLNDVPAGLNSMIVSASGYPQSSRLRAVIADQSVTVPSITAADISIDANSGNVDEAVTKLISATEGGDLTTKDGRFSLYIFPDTLSADAKITLCDVIDGPNAPIGNDMPLDPVLEFSGVKVASVLTNVQIAAINDSDPAPTIRGVAAVAMRYSQKDAEDFQLDENSAFPYFWNGTSFSVLNQRPYEVAVDKTNNIVYAVMDFSKTATGSDVSVMQSSIIVSSGAANILKMSNIIFAVGKYALQAFLNNPRVRIYDKNELNCVTSASPDQKPNPNALPLLFMHGFDPLDTVIPFGPNPNRNGRYYLMLQDIVEATNGVYRPIFVSYNTRAKIADIGGKLAEKVFGEYLNEKIMIKGLPSDPNNPDSGAFPYLDTFGYSMGGLVSRSFLNESKLNMVHNMMMIATPNHGTFSLLKYLTSVPTYWASYLGLRILNPGARDMQDYDDSNLSGRVQNPFLYSLNSLGKSRSVMPRGDIRLFAGHNEEGYGIFGTFLTTQLDRPHDSLVPVRSVYCRPTSSTLESGLSLLTVNEPRARKYEIPSKDFNHDNVGKSTRLKEFITEIVLGFSDWVVEREYNENPLDNAFVPPDASEWGYCNSKVKVDYNVWKPDAECQARDFDRVVLVIYHKDGTGKWHISEPKGGGNGADSNGSVISTKVASISGNSKDRPIENPLILYANVNFDPNPDNKPENEIVDTISLVIPLKPGKMMVPIDPANVQFRIPKLSE